MGWLFAATVVVFGVFVVVMQVKLIRETLGIENKNHKGPEKE
tara:strand:+ start:2403 stop:2528 length:126 start_codon:yes stop_codon:yes gene_type:complete